MCRCLSTCQATVLAEVPGAGTWAEVAIVQEGAVTQIPGQDGAVQQEDGDVSVPVVPVRAQVSFQLGGCTPAPLYVGKGAAQGKEQVVAQEGADTQAEVVRLQRPAAVEQLSVAVGNRVAAGTEAVVGTAGVSYLLALTQGAVYHGVLAV